MNDPYLLIPILVPVAAAAAILLFRRRLLSGVLSVVAAFATLAAAIWLFGRGDSRFVQSWGGYGLEFSLRLYNFSAFLVLAASAFGAAVALYSWSHSRDERFPNQFYAYLLLTVGAANGAFLADHLVTMLFFWEGMLGVMFGFIAIGRPGAWRTAIKALIIAGTCDLCLLVGVAIVASQGAALFYSIPSTQPVEASLAWEHALTNGFTMSALANLPAGHSLQLAGLGGIAFVLLMIGAIGKGGSMPFHSWIPDAAEDAPLPFMAILPASLEKLLGIYFLTRITMDLFHLDKTGGESWACTLMMIVGAITIVFAVMMALVQKNYKRLLSYHAISQVGYMILGVGTGSAIGIVGGLFHMVNNGLYKSCLFLTGGAVERQTGSSDLSKLGGLAKSMPITCGCFLVAAFSISGFPFTNGFYSKELVYDAAKARGWIFYLAALVGSVFTAASFLKLGHAAYFGKRDPAAPKVKEAPAAMLIPMVVLAATCLLFGLGNAIPIEKFIQPVLSTSLAEHSAGEHFATIIPHSALLVALTVVALAVALGSHIYGVKKTGSGLGASEHWHHAPALSAIYERAERRGFDPYDLARRPVKMLALTGWIVDRLVDWVNEGLTVGVTKILSYFIRAAHTGSYAMYIGWSLAGALAVLWFLVRAG